MIFSCERERARGEGGGGDEVSFFLFCFFRGARSRRRAKRQSRRRRISSSSSLLLSNSSPFLLRPLSFSPLSFLALFLALGALSAVSLLRRAGSGGQRRRETKPNTSKEAQRTARQREPLFLSPRSLSPQAPALFSPGHKTNRRTSSEIGIVVCLVETKGDERRVLFWGCFGARKECALRKRCEARQLIFPFSFFFLTSTSPLFLFLLSFPTLSLSLSSLSLHPLFFSQSKISRSRSTEKGWWRGK